MALTREQIVKAEDMPKPQKVQVPEWNGDVYVRMLNVGERGEWEDMCFGEDGKPKLKTRPFSIETVVCMVCDETGVPLFEADDAKVVALKHPDVVERIALEAMRFNGLDLKSAEETAKNLPETQTGDSNTN